MKGDWLSVSSLGTEFAVAVFIGAFLGYQVDRFFNLSPWGMVVGLIVGAAAGYLTIYKYMMDDNGHN